MRDFERRLLKVEAKARMQVQPETAEDPLVFLLIIHLADRSELRALLELAQAHKDGGPSPELSDRYAPLLANFARAHAVAEEIATRTPRHAATNRELADHRTSDAALRRLGFAERKAIVARAADLLVEHGAPAPAEPWCYRYLGHVPNPPETWTLAEMAARMPAATALFVADLKAAARKEGTLPAIVDRLDDTRFRHRLMTFSTELFDRHGDYDATWGEGVTWLAERISAGVDDDMLTRAAWLAHFDAHLRRRVA